MVISFHKMKWDEMRWDAYFFWIHWNFSFPKLSKNCFGIIFHYIVGYWMSFHGSFSSFQFSSIQFMKWFCLWFDRIASKYNIIHDIKWYCIVLYCIVLHCIA
jgi:hypothetical protein